jgi:hypothetical protein
MSEPGRLATMVARLVWATRIVDKLYGRFNQLRTRVVMRRAPAGFFDAYNDVAFSRQAAYRPDSTVFRDDLFLWEQQAIDDWFPAPPATILIGGVGGGREALALARRGYAVTAFEPARDLVVGLTRRLQRTGAAIGVYEGRYETLPMVVEPNGARVDLSARAPFDAAIFGWASYSHLRTDALRIDALRAMARLARGPILLSYFPFADARRAESAEGSFGLFTGYFRDLTEDDVRAQAEAAGVDVLWLLHDTGWPRAILRARP